MAKILIVEDEIKIANLLRDYCEHAGHNVCTVGDGNKVLEAFLAFNPDVVLLDVMLPGQDGIAICRQIRKQSSCGIIIISARVEEVDRLLGLQTGADDYVCKPFSPKEVTARIESVLRRLHPQSIDSSTLSIYIDEPRRKVIIDGQGIVTTPSEYQIMKILAAVRGRIYSRTQLIQLLRDEHADFNERAIDSHIKNLRKKIKAVLGEREIIKSVYGVGYKVDG